MKKIIKDQILEHLKQHGFMRRRSSVTQLLSYHDTCAQSIARGSVVDVIYLLYTKAFEEKFHIKQGGGSKRKVAVRANYFYL